MSSLFITGASGFIGRHLLQTLDAEAYERIYCLTRREITPPGPVKGKVECIRGGIEEIKACAPYLARSDTVVHLAAATGKATRREYFAVNAQGTRTLVQECERACVRNFLLVSTIAVKYPDRSQYWYAQSKEQAEEAIKRSRMHYAIVRPTIVIGEEGPTWKTLAKLGRSPIPVVFGAGVTRIQPIYIKDLADCLSSILSDGSFTNETFELGGPEPITFEDFIQRVHFHYYGQASPVAHVPLKPFVALLSGLQDRLPSILPINAGQLSAFYNDGTIETNRIFDGHVSRMKNIDQMLAEMITNGK